MGDDRDYYVYTPAGYDPHESKRYPVLYLLHGFSDDASGWTAVGRAHVILDNLIAPGKAKPMLVVMPLGYGAPEFVTPRVRRLPRRRPAPEELRPVPRRAAHRGHPGGGEHLSRRQGPRVARHRRPLDGRARSRCYVGLNALDRFAWVGAFSSGGLPEDYEATFPGLDAKANDRLRLLWIACGTEDRLIDANRKLHAWLDTKGVKHTHGRDAGRAHLDGVAPEPGHASCRCSSSSVLEEQVVAAQVELPPSPG